MAKLTLAQAAALVGKSKSTLSRSIKAGKLSAVRGSDGTFTVDHSELIRVYPDAVRVDVTRSNATALDADATHSDAAASAADLQSLDALQAALADAEHRAAIAEAVAEERARALEAAERNISDLRRLLPPSSSRGHSLPLSRPWWRFW